jgi:hypothetical protein
MTGCPMLVAVRMHLLSGITPSSSSPNSSYFEKDGGREARGEEGKCECRDNSRKRNRETLSLKLD